MPERCRRNLFRDAGRHVDVRTARTTPGPAGHHAHRPSAADDLAVVPYPVDDPREVGRERVLRSRGA